jgi:hypothetical protein
MFAENTFKVFQILSKSFSSFRDNVYLQTGRWTGNLCLNVIYEVKLYNCTKLHIWEYYVKLFLETF